MASERTTVATKWTPMWRQHPLERQREPGATAGRIALQRAVPASAAAGRDGPAQFDDPRGGGRVTQQTQRHGYTMEAGFPARLDQAAHTAFVLFAVASVLFYIARFWSVLTAGELFHRLGFDWTLFYAQAMALRAGAGPGIYDQETINRYLQPLLAYYGGPQTSLDGWPQPYPPFFAAVMAPFTLPPAPVGFALWLAV